MCYIHAGAYAAVLIILTGPAPLLANARFALTNMILLFFLLFNMFTLFSRRTIRGAPKPRKSHVFGSHVKMDPVRRETDSYGSLYVCFLFIRFRDF